MTDRNDEDLVDKLDRFDYGGRHRVHDRLRRIYLLPLGADQVRAAFRLSRRWVPMDAYQGIPHSHYAGFTDDHVQVDVLVRYLDDRKLAAELVSQQLVGR